MKLQTLLIAALLLCAPGLRSAPITPDMALERALVSSHLKSVRGKTPELRHIIPSSDGRPALYVFTYSGTEGFMLLSADDTTLPLLGYSATNGFSMAEMPSNLRSWLSLYVDAIEDARMAGGPSCEAAATRLTRADDMAPVGPLLTTAWDQGAPYNNLCPRTDAGKSVTGCVATAMAQIMNYWKFPEHGTGEISYSPKNFQETLSLDLSSTIFDWDNMLDTYTRNFTQASATAVATLMKACGYSVEMDYSPYSSGTQSSKIALALTRYFGYDIGTKRIERENYTQDSWNRIIYNELAMGCPVICDGQSSEGGHSFVCDGYDGNGLYHINWGWGGMSDGYFQLNELTPSSVGTGGHYGGYNMRQDAIIGIMPPAGRLTVNEISIDNAADDSGRVQGQGYVYRIRDFSDIHVAVTLTVSGGHVTSPLYATVYETDPSTFQNKGVVLDTTFEEGINATDSRTTCATTLRIDGADVSKLYTLNVAYELKGQKTTIGSLRMAASSGIEETLASDENILTLSGDLLLGPHGVRIEVYALGGQIVASGIETVSLSGLAPGVYIARAGSRTIKLHLK